jgi:hypothetical protein
MFRKTQDIPVGVPEPGDLRAGGRSPDAQLVLVHTLIALEADSGLPQALHGRSDLRDLPAQYGAVSRRKFFRHAETQHDAIRVKDQRKRRLLHHQAKAERVLIEIFRAGYVDDGNESDDVVFAESGMLRHAAIMIFFARCRKNAVAT